MKKFLFALQVFGLIAILPVYVSFEMSHGTQTITASNAKEQLSENNDPLSVDLDISISKYPVAALAFSQIAVKTKQKSSNAGCTCQHCKCGSNCMCSTN